MYINNIIVSVDKIPKYGFIITANSNETVRHLGKIGLGFLLGFLLGFSFGIYFWDLFAIPKGKSQIWDFCVFGNPKFGISKRKSQTDFTKVLVATYNICFYLENRTGLSVRYNNKAKF